MEKAKLPLYIRFGEIPENKLSKVHRGDQVVRTEGGLSVWDAISDGMGNYYPILPEDANDDAVADYFRFLLNSRLKVYLVTGTKTFLEGADREPLIMDPIIIKDITNSYKNIRAHKKEYFYNYIKNHMKLYLELHERSNDVWEEVKQIMNDFLTTVEKDLENREF